MPKIEEARSALSNYEAALRTKLQVPAGEDWNAYLPENSMGDRMFAGWQRLGVVVRRLEERQQ